MISATAGQLSDLLEVARHDSFRVQIADNTDTLQDVSANVLSLEVTRDVNTNAKTATVVMQRETSAGSLSPLMSGTPAIYPRRRIVIDLVVKRYDESIGGADWVERFNGFVDLPQFGGREARMSLACRDHWRVLYDTFIETETEYGSPSGVAIETVIQSILDDNLTSSYTLSVVGTPTTTIKTFTQRRMRLSEALLDLANYTGWDLRFVGSTLTYQEPPRSKTTPDYTFTTKQYFDVPQLAIDPSGIINRVVMEWEAGSAVVGVDSTSVTNWGKLAMFVDGTQDPQFTTSGAAQSLVDIVVSDRANPLTLMTVTGRLFPFAEIWDLYRWPADGILYSSDLDLAVSKIVDTIPEAGTEPGPTTTLYMSGSPSGGVDRWERLRWKTERAQQVSDVVGTPQPSPDATISAAFATDGVLSATLDGSAQAIKSWKILGAIGTAPTQANIELETAIDGTSLDETDIGTLATATTGGDVGHVAAIGYTGLAGAGTATAVLRDQAVFGTSTDGIPDGGVTGPKIAPGAVVATKMKRQAMSFTSSVQFTSSAYNALEWLGGTIKFADGTSGTIDSGNAGTLTQVAYIYYNGTSTLQVTTAYDTAIADESYVTLCVCAPGGSEEGGCFYVPSLGVMGNSQLSITANQIVALAVKAVHIESINLTTLQAAVGTLSALSDDVGIVVSGVLQNSAGTNYVDLDATGSGIFIKAGTAFSVTADGTATFGGTVTSSATVAATTFTASNMSLAGDITFATAKGLIGPNGQTWGATPNVGSGAYWNANCNISAVDLLLSGNVELGTAGAVNGTTVSITGTTVVLGGAGTSLAFYGAAGTAKPTVTGSRGSNAALASLLTALSNLGLVTDSSS